MTRLSVESFTAATADQVRKACPDGGSVAVVPNSPWVDKAIRGKIMPGEKLHHWQRPAVYGVQKAAGIGQQAAVKTPLGPGEGAGGVSNDAPVFVLEASGNSNTDRGIAFNDVGQAAVDRGAVRAWGPIFRELEARGVSDVLIRGWNGGHATNRHKIGSNGVQYPTLGASGLPEVQLGAMPFPCVGEEPNPGFACGVADAVRMFPGLRIGPWMGRMCCPNIGTQHQPEYAWLTGVNETVGGRMGVGAMNQAWSPRAVTMDQMLAFLDSVHRWHLSLGFRCFGWDEENIERGSLDEPEDQTWASLAFWGMPAPRRVKGLRRIVRNRFARVCAGFGASLAAGDVRLFQEDAEPGGCEFGSSLVRVVSRRKYAQADAQAKRHLYCVDTAGELGSKIAGLRTLNPGAAVVGLMISDFWDAAEFNDCVTALQGVGATPGIEGYVAGQVGWLDVRALAKG